MYLMGGPMYLMGKYKYTLYIKIMAYTGSSIPPLPPGAIGYTMTKIIPTFKKLPRKQGTKLCLHVVHMLVCLCGTCMYMRKGGGVCTACSQVYPALHY